MLRVCVFPKEDTRVLVFLRWIARSPSPRRNASIRVHPTKLLRDAAVGPRRVTQILTGPHTRHHSTWEMTVDDVLFAICVGHHAQSRDKDVAPYECGVLKEVCGGLQCVVQVVYIRILRAELVPLTSDTERTVHLEVRLPLKSIWPRLMAVDVECYELVVTGIFDVVTLVHPCADCVRALRKSRFELVIYANVRRLLRSNLVHMRFCVRNVLADAALHIVTRSVVHSCSHMIVRIIKNFNAAFNILPVIGLVWRPMKEGCCCAVGVKPIVNATETCIRSSASVHPYYFYTSPCWLSMKKQNRVDCLRLFLSLDTNQTPTHSLTVCGSFRLRHLGVNKLVSKPIRPCLRCL